MEYTLCACGCREPITRKPRPGRPNKYIHGHHRRGKPLSKEHKKHIGISNSGRKMSKRQRELLSKIHRENHRNKKVIHWSKTEKREEIAKKISKNSPAIKKPKKKIKGRYITHNGYVMIWFRNHFGKRYGYMLEHRYVMEKYLDRPLKPTEDVHHIDGDKTNNSIKNLVLFPSRSAHSKFHAHRK